MTHSCNPFVFLDVLKETVGSARLAQFMDTAEDLLCVFRSFLTDQQAMCEPDSFINQMRSCIEDKIGAPCIEDECGELSVHPANFGFARIEPLRIRVRSAGSRHRLLLIAEHGDALPRSYFQLYDVCTSTLQPDLHSEESSIQFSITDKPHRLRLHLTMSVSRPDDVFRLILRACFLLHMYHNALLEELHLMPGQAPDECDDDFDIPPIPSCPRVFRPFIRPDEPDDPFPIDSKYEGDVDHETDF